MRNRILRSCVLVAVSLSPVIQTLDSRAADAPTPATRPSTSTRPAAAPPAPLTDEEKQAGWRLLFDGTTTAGWRVLGGDHFPAEQWVVQDGCLRHLPVKGAHDLAYDRPVGDFELSFQWMIPKPKGNSGIKYRVQETKGGGTAYGPEYQLMSDAGTVNTNSTGSLYDVLPPTGPQVKPPGEFNHSQIVARGDHVEHWLNGAKVLEFDFGSDAVNAAVAQSKFKDSKVWGRNPRGLIVLQAHGDEAWFRDIRLREPPAADK